MTLGKFIIKHCGNEGNMQDEQKTSLRKLLHEIVSFLKCENSNVWKNAEINIYDNDKNAFQIISGYGENIFVVQYTGKSDHIDIVNIERPHTCVLF